MATDVIRLLSVSASGYLGGAERSLCELLNSLDRSRFELHVCAPAKGVLAEHLSKCGIAVHSLEFEPLRRTRRPILFARQIASAHAAARKLRTLCKKLDVHIVHANTDPAAVVAWHALRSSKLPLIWHCRDLRPLHGLARMIGRRVSAVVAISEAVERHLVGEGVDPEKIALIMNGIDLSRFANVTNASRARASLNLDKDAAVLVSVGSFVPWKRHEIFLRTLAQLKQRIPSIVGLLAGSDAGGLNATYARKLRDLAVELSLQETLRFLGEWDDIPEIFSAADVLVSCSDNEPFGRVLAEAGATGLPVVATRSGAKAEIVADGQSGLLVDSSVDAVAGACERLLKNAGLRRKMGRLAHERIAAQFDVKRTAAQLTSLMMSVLA